MSAHREHPAADHRAVVHDGAQLVDVRQPDEFAQGTLPGAVNIPLGELTSLVGRLDPDRRVVLICRSGARSNRAAELLAERGFTDVVDLTGGMLAVDDAR